MHYTTLRPHVATELTAARAARRAGDDGLTWSHLERAHILVVDDEPNAAEQAATILRELGHVATVANSWTEAVRAFDPLVTDLVLMDAVMPNMDGLKLTRLLREQSRSYVPVVFLTGQRSAELRDQCIDAGADDFLTKPIDRVELRARLKAMLRIRALTRALEEKTHELELAGELLRDWE